MTDPFGVLGLARGATADEVRSARRDLARRHHPDAGGDAAVMQGVNAAAAHALRILADHPVDGGTSSAGPDAPTPAGRDPDWVPEKRDVPSFTVEALPAETFEALLVACAELGEVEDDDPPYELRTRLASPLACWCQLDVVPDAGASTVSVSIAPLDGEMLPMIVDVRNAWISALNGLDWSSFSPAMLEEVSSSKTTSTGFVAGRQPLRMGR